MKKQINGKELLKKYTIYVVLILMMFVGRLVSPNFLSWSNLTNVMRQVAVYCILSFGMTILIINGMVDLSMGAVIALSGYLACKLFVTTNSMFLAIISAIGISLVCNLINGVGVTYFNLPPFIATMAMDLVARGLVYIYSGGNPIYQIGAFNKLSTTLVFGKIPMSAIITLFLFAITHVILKYTKLGRHFYAIGGNTEAARASGVNIYRTKIMAYLISGVFVAIAGCLQMARLNSAIPDTAVGYHADAVAAAVIGGTAFGGGVGTATGTLAGGLVIGLLSNIMNLAGVQSYIQMVFRGFIILATVAWSMKNKSVKSSNAVKNSKK